MSDYTVLFEQFLNPTGSDMIIIMLQPVCKANILILFGFILHCSLTLVKFFDGFVLVLFFLVEFLNVFDTHAAFWPISI